MKPGVHVIRLSLESNAFDFLATYTAIKANDRIRIGDLKIKIIALVGFYECFLKWAISLIDKKSLLKRKGDPFDQEKFDSGNFRSIGLKECLSVAVSNKWICEEERTSIAKIEEIRNKIVHYALVGETIFFETNAIEIDFRVFDEQNEIIAKLLDLFKERYSRSTRFEYEDLPETYRGLS